MFTWIKNKIKADISREISAHSKYFEECIHLNPLPMEDGVVLDRLSCPSKKTVRQIDDLPDALSQTQKQLQKSTLILLHANFNHHLDIEGLLRDLKPKLSRQSRVTVITYNPYLRWLYLLVNRLGIRQGELPTTFLTYTDLGNLTRLSGYEIVRIRPTAYFPPWNILRLLPIIKHLSLVHIIMLRPVIPENNPLKLSVLIPARNEKGNIENALKRLQSWTRCPLEIIFVEGHSSDDTWTEIQRVLPLYKDHFELKAIHQTGKGKRNAVKCGFEIATGDLLTILDADLTMPPEMLSRFYEAYQAGLADFVNGSRLLYPFEGEAMRFLNHLGNIFFAKALSFVLDTRIGDSLCGTKLLSRADYLRVKAWNEDFGEFDPFGDYELLFPASVLGLGIIDVPIHYKARTYGSTNISRFAHGFLLLKMTWIGLFRIKLK